MNGMKKCVIVVNAYSRLQSSLNQSQRLRQEFADMGVQADIYPADALGCAVEEDGSLSCALSGYDFCVYLDKDKYAARMLEKLGMRLFNSARAVEDCDDKMQTFIRLADMGIPMPKTLPAPLCYDPQMPVKEDILRGVERELGYPVIIKSAYGSLGAGVFMASDWVQLKAAAERLKCSPHLFQRYVAESCGRDVRVIVVGGRVVAAMERRSRGDFRSNIELGGVGRPFTPDEALAKLCVRAAEGLGLDYCGADVLFGREGYLLCEVNSNAFFGGIERVAGINVAREYALYMYKTIYGGMPDAV